MNIGAAAAASGLPAKTIRYYESIGLVRPALRTGANYRVYGEADLHTLRFVKRARNLGFSVEEAAQLLELWRDRSRASADVKAMAMRHVAELQAKIAELEAMRRALQHLADCCAGDARPDCPILEDLAEGEGGQGGAERRSTALTTGVDNVPTCADHPAMKTAEDLADINIHLRARPQDRALIDRAAELVGANRSQFMLASALKEAKSVLLDQTTIHADARTFQKVLGWLDRPATKREQAGMKRIIAASAPWKRG